MRKYFYIEITEEFAVKNNGYTNGACLFNSTQTKEGIWVTSANALNEFPELFENIEVGKPVELSPKDFQIDYEPPAMSGTGVIIPEKFEWLFKEDKFELNGFEVLFDRVESNLVVDIAYLSWRDFQIELDKPENAVLKHSLVDVWDYVLEQIEVGNTVELDKR